MRYRPLGGTGMLVSELGFGTANFGDSVDATTAGKLVSAALDAGINLFDTADVYAQGRSEELLGVALRGERERVVLCSKVGSRVGDQEGDLHASLRADGLDHAARWNRGIAPTDRGLSRKHIVAAVEASLRRLGTDYIDLYQVHRYDPDTPAEEALSAFADLIRSGKVRAIGCSGWAAWQLYRGLWVSDIRGLPRFHSEQVPYNVLERESERDLLPACRSADVGVLVYRGLAGGLLSGRYQAGGALDPRSRMGSRDGYRGRYLTAPMIAGAEAVLEEARVRGRNAADLSLAWLLARPGVTSVLLGASSPEQFADGIRATETPLSPAEADALSAAVARRVEAARTPS